METGMAVSCNIEGNYAFTIWHPLQVSPIFPTVPNGKSTQLYSDIPPAPVQIYN